MDWKNLVLDMAPALGTALLGPAGGIATKFLADKLLGKPGASESEIAAAVKDMTPEMQIQLKQLELDFKKHAADVGLDLERLQLQQDQVAAADRADARAMQVEMRSWVPPTLAMLVTAGFFGILGVMLFYGLQQSSSQPLLIMLGSLGTAWTTIMAFYFGSSKGSADKTAILQNAISSQGGTRS